MHKIFNLLFCEVACLFDIKDYDFAVARGSNSIKLFSLQNKNKTKTKTKKKGK